MYTKNNKNEERIELADQVIMIEKLIAEKKMQLKMLNTWLRKTQEKGNAQFKQMDAEFEP